MYTSRYWSNIKQHGYFYNQINWLTGSEHEAYEQLANNYTCRRHQEKSKNYYYKPYYICQHNPF